MATYKISAADQDLDLVSAESAKDALDSFCEARPDDDYGFQRGGLQVDSRTRGTVWASVRTDGGRITAALA